jgi:hypothetical protein
MESDPVTPPEDEMEILPEEQLQMPPEEETEEGTTGTEED